MFVDDKIAERLLVAYISSYGLLRRLLLLVLPFGFTLFFAGIWGSRKLNYWEPD